MVPMHLLGEGHKAAYINTGKRSEGALTEAGRRGQAYELWGSGETTFARVPQESAWELASDTAYLHYTSNNTIYGTQFASTPQCGDVPVVCDMSSDILSRPIEASRFGLIYAGAQKNLSLIHI